MGEKLPPTSTGAIGDSVAFAKKSKLANLFTTPVPPAIPPVKPKKEPVQDVACARLNPDQLKWVATTKLMLGPDASTADAVRWLIDAAWGVYADEVTRVADARKQLPVIEPITLSKV
jgi:hypothetical protein